MSLEAQILSEATFAANAAAEEAAKLIPEGQIYCGSAWLTIRPARGPFVAYLKKIGRGERGDYGGYTLTIRLAKDTQQLAIREAAQRAAKLVLAEYGIKAFVNTYSN